MDRRHRRLAGLALAAGAVAGVSLQPLTLGLPARSTARSGTAWELGRLCADDYGYTYAVWQDNSDPGRQWQDDPVHPVSDVSNAHIVVRCVDVNDHRWD